jgi:hypothetical protein
MIAILMSPDDADIVNLLIKRGAKVNTVGPGT